MKAIITGSCGLVGFAASCRLLDEGWEVVGIDNNKRQEFFGPTASTLGLREQLERRSSYSHVECDIRAGMVLKDVIKNFDLFIHCAAQPSHDWATSNIYEDFTINALGTLNLLEMWRNSCPRSPFIHVSTSKVYGDNPNRLPLQEFETRWDLPSDHSLVNGIPEGFSVDHCLHSFFGVSKLSGDLLAQEFGKHFGLPVGIFRPGCITGGHHKGAELHGFLSYLMKCVASGTTYRVYGYKGKQVRCNVHADDLVAAFMLFAANPIPGAVYNVGGRPLDCSLLEAVADCEERCGRKAILDYKETPRTGDHTWWVSDTRKLRSELGWVPKRLLGDILDEIYEDAAKELKDA